MQFPYRNKANWKLQLERQGRAIGIFLEMCFIDSIILIAPCAPILTHTRNALSQRDLNENSCTIFSGGGNRGATAQETKDLVSRLRDEPEELHRLGARANTKYRGEKVLVSINRQSSE